MIRLREALGRSVVARDTAETIGEVGGAVVDPPSGRILAVQVGKGGKSRLADWAVVSGVGPDAVVVESEGSLRDPHGEWEPRVVKGDVPLLGARVLSARGDELGTLDDVEFDESTGRLLTLVAGGQPIAATRLRSIGSWAVVVSADGGDPPAPPSATRSSSDR